MPHIAITMIPGRTAEEKKKLAARVHEFITAELQIDGKYVSVSVEDILKENWNQSMEKLTDDIMYVKPGV